MKALDLTIPPRVLARANEVVEWKGAPSSRWLAALTHGRTWRERRICNDRIQMLGGDVPHVADLAWPQREPAAIQGRHCRGCRRPQRADPLQDVLGHGNRGKTVEKERAQASGRAESAERQASAGNSENPIGTIKNFVCKYLC